MSLKEIQDLLSRKGYSPGAIDGLWGPQTERAAKEAVLAAPVRVITPEPIPQPDNGNIYHVKYNILYKGDNPVSFKQAPCHGGRIKAHETIVVHYDGADNLGGFNWLCDPRSNVSAHFWISKAGVVWQLLELDTVGWHAGRGEWNDHVNDLTSYSIGIENQGVGDHWPEAQIEANIAVIGALLKAYPGMDVIGHEDYAPGRKSDPGPNFPWARVGKAAGF